MGRRQRRKGDRLTREDLNEIFEEYYARLFNYFFYRTLNRALSDDLVSASMLNVVRAYESFDPERGNLDQWVFGIARNALYTHFRKAKTDADIDEVPQGYLAYEDPDQLELDERGAQVAKMLEALSDEERELVYLKYWEELSNREIASRLGLNASTVSTKLWRANDKMRRAMPGDKN